MNKTVNQLIGPQFSIWSNSKICVKMRRGSFGKGCTLDLYYETLISFLLSSEPRVLNMFLHRYGSCGLFNIAPRVISGRTSPKSCSHLCLMVTRGFLVQRVQFTE